MRLSKFLLTVVLFVTCEITFALKLNYLSDTSIPNGAQYEKSIVGGISGLVFDPVNNVYIGVSDDRGANGSPRFYKFEINIIESKKNTKSTSDYELKVKIVGVQNILDSDKKGFKENQLDMEGVAILPWQNLFISSEGGLKEKPPVLPQLMDVKPNGQFVRSFPFPEYYLPKPKLKGEKEKYGIRENRGFEGISSSPSGKSIFVALENPLHQDSNEPTTTSGAPTRILKYEMPEAWVVKATAEYIYPLDPIRDRGVLFKGDTNGIGEVLAIDDTKLFVLERGGGYTPSGFEQSAKIFFTDLSSGQNIIGTSQISKDQKSLLKNLILDFDDLSQKIKSGKLDNMEAMVWGPKLPDGRRTVLVVSDDNFNKLQHTLFVLLVLEE